MAGKVKALCVLACGRLAVYKNGCCVPCNNRTKLEGTQKELGLIAESPVHARWREQAKQYNRLARQGMPQKDIAALFGMETRKLRTLVYRMKTEAGIKIAAVVRAKRSAAPPGVPTNKTRAHKNDHGGGKWGIDGCPCEPCVLVRRATRRQVELNRDRRQKNLVAKLEARVAELEALLLEGRHKDV